MQYWMEPPIRLLPAQLMTFYIGSGNMIDFPRRMGLVTVAPECPWIVPGTRARWRLAESFRLFERPDHHMASTSHIQPMKAQ